MKTPEEPLPPDAEIIRVLGPAFVPERDHTKPVPDAFRVTESDKSHAEKKGLEPYLSVWDLARTTVEQAIKFRERGDPSTLKAFAIRVGLVMELAQYRLPDRNVRVIRVVHERADLPGADGYSGILGIDRRTGEVRARYKRLQIDLASACHPVE